MADRLRLGVIFGGRSVEHEVSVVSAQDVLNAADKERFDVVAIGVTKDGVWLTPEETALQLSRPAKPFEQTLESSQGDGLLGNSEAIAVLRDVDVAFPLVHGTHGEDGTLQGFLELAGIPYVGAGVAASAIGMDKELMKRLFKDAGLDVVDHVALRLPHYKDNPKEAQVAVEDAVGYPAFVKPANGGSSVGISNVHSREDLAAAMCTAFRYDRKVLVERAVDAREVECAVLGNDDPEPSPVGEIRYTREFYDYEAKYLDPSTELLIPANVSPDIAAQVQQLAVRGYRAIDCAGMGRMDFFLTNDGRLYIDEVNTLPGFTPGSMYPRLWEHAGVSYSGLVSRLVDLALERHGRRVDA